MASRVLQFLVVKAAKRFNKWLSNHGISYAWDANAYDNANMIRSCFHPKGRSESDRNGEIFQNKKEQRYKCRECDSFGHYQVECANFLRRKKKGFVSTFCQMMNLNFWSSVKADEVELLNVKFVDSSPIVYLKVKIIEKWQVDLLVLDQYKNNIRNLIETYLEIPC